MKLFLSPFDVKKNITLVKILNLSNDLKNIGDAPCVFEDNSDNRIFEYALKYFNIITKFQDDIKINPNLLPLAKESAAALKTHIEQAGRNKNGLIRSKKGEAVTLENLFLGGMHNTKMDSVENWLSDKSEFEKNRQILLCQLINKINSNRLAIINFSKTVLLYESKTKSMFGFNSKNNEKLR